MNKPHLILMDGNRMDLYATVSMFERLVGRKATKEEVAAAHAQIEAAKAPKDRVMQGGENADGSYTLVEARNR
jgi:hypothetical protein